MISKFNNMPKIELNEKELEDAKKELEELIKTVPYNLSVALIKITLINNYLPLELEKYYQKILPAFSLLRRTDGSKYQSQSMTTVRSAMVSNKLYYKNNEGLYILNIPNALKVVKMIRNKKKPMKEEDVKNLNVENLENIKNGIENFDINNSGALLGTEKEKKSKKNSEDLLGKKKKLKNIKKKGKDGVKNRIEKFQKTYSLLKNLLKVSANDKLLYSQLNFDFAEISDSTKIDEKKINVDKIIGMLSVFKFFMPFLERCFSSIEIQDNVMEKVTELNSEVTHMDSVFRFEE